MLRTSVFLLLFLSTANVLHAQTAEQEEMQFLVIEALTKNPRIAADASRMDVMEHRISQASGLDYPEFTYRLMEFPGTRFNEAMYQRFELAQMISFPTKLSTKRNIATIQAEHAHHDHLETILDVVTDLKTAYAMLWSARTRLSINIDDQRLLQQIIASAQTQYAAGKSSMQEVLKTNIELSKVKSESATIEQEREIAESMMRALLFRPATVPIGTIQLAQFSPLPHSLNDLLSHALSSRPMLIHDSLNVVEGNLMVSLSKQEYLPDFRFSIERVTMPVGGPSSWGIMAGLTLPFAPWTLSKTTAQVQEASAELEMRSSMYTSTRSMVEAEIRKEYAKVRALEAQVQLYEKNIVPQTFQSLQSLMTEYQSGQTSYLMLIDGFRMYQETRMQATMIRMNLEEERARLERSVGVTDLNLVTRSREEN